MYIDRWDKTSIKKNEERGKKNEKRNDKERNERIFERWNQF